MAFFGGISEVASIHESTFEDSHCSTEIDIDEETLKLQLQLPPPDHRCPVCLSEHTQGRRYSTRLLEGKKFNWMYEHNCKLDNAEDSITQIIWPRRRPAWFNYMQRTTAKKRKVDSNEHNNEEPHEKKPRRIIYNIKVDVGTKRTYRVISKQRRANFSPISL